MGEFDEKTVDDEATKTIVDGEAPDGAEGDDAEALAAKERAIAERIGWVDEDKWEGDPNSWRPHDEYLQRSDVQIARRVLMESEAQIAAKAEEDAKRRAEDDKRFEDLRAATSRTIELVQKSAEEHYQSQLEELNKREIEAVENKDVDGFKAIQEERVNLPRPDPIEVGEKPDPTDEIQSRLKERPWTENKVLMRFAERAIAAEIERGGDMSIEEQFEYADIYMQSNHADQLSKYAKTEDNPVGEGRRRTDFTSKVGDPADTRSHNNVDEGGVGEDLPTGGGENYGLSSIELTAAKSLVEEGHFKSIKEYAQYTKEIDEKGLTHGGRRITA